MTDKQRVYAALNHQTPDRVPYQIGFTEKALQAMRQYCGGNEFLELIDNCTVGVAPNPTARQKWPDEDTWQDEFGVQWDRSIDRDIGNVCNQAIPDRDLSSYRFPDPSSPDRFEGLADRCASADDKFVQFSIGFSLFERAWTLRGGLDTVFMDMMDAPNFVHDLLEAICDYNIALIEQAAGYDIDGIHFGDDWGAQSGLLMAPDTWERFLAPQLQRQYAAANDAGKFVKIHSCGRVQQLFPQLIEMGVDCFNPFQPEVMDVYEMKRLYGDRLSFWGGVSTQQLLPFGTPRQTRDEVRRLLDEIGKDGGYICAPAHAIPGGAKPENIMAMIETVNDQ